MVSTSSACRHSVAGRGRRSVDQRRGGAGASRSARQAQGQIRVSCGQRVEVAAGGRAAPPPRVVEDEGGRPPPPLLGAARGGRPRAPPAGARRAAGGGAG